MIQALSHLYLPGAVTMWCAVIFALAALWGYTRALNGDSSALPFARRGYNFYALSVLLSCVVLVICLWRRDFRIEYVYQYSGLDLAGHFQIAAFWAGQKGSFLLWLLFAVLIGIPVGRSAGRHEPTVMWVYMLSQMGLLIILAKNNPFVMLPEAPVDGAGLNPLLQDDWMVIHPPVMFVGYAATAIPYAFAIAALWRGDTKDWAARAFPWTLAGFLVLGTAILMGGYWAYKTLGWGGYWGWDPVENASLIPWLLGVVLIHGMYLEKTRKRYRRLNLVLACLLFLSVLYGTFLTRSGVLADFSVHSFVDLGLSAWLVAIMSFHGFLSVGLLVYRWRTIDTGANEDPLFSRGTLLVLSTIVVGISTVMVTFGTSAPLITRWYLDNPAQVGPEFYNTVNMPLALMAAMLLTLVPFFTWRDVDTNKLARQLVPSFLGAIVLTLVVGLSVRVEETFHWLMLFLAAWALGSNLHKVITLARQNGFASVGGYLAHVGVGIMLIGVLTSSAYDFSTKVTLPQGEAVQVGDLSLTFQQFIPRQGREKERMEVKVDRGDGFAYLAYPKLFVNDRTKQLMANPDVKKTFFQDFYISPIQYEPAEAMNVDHRVMLTRGQSSVVGDIEVRFVDFEMQGHDAGAQLAAGGTVEVGARLELVRQGQTQAVRALYRFDQAGNIDSPPIPLQDSGAVALTGIDPRTGSVQVAISSSGDLRPVPPRLSVDLTRKPLIALVWYGLYVILFGGLLSTIKRFKQSSKLDEIEAKIAQAQASA